MRLAPRLALIAMLALAGCQMALPFGGDDAPPPAPLPGGEIEVTALDAAPSAAVPPGGADVGGIEPRSAGVATDGPAVAPEPDATVTAAPEAAPPDPEAAAEPVEAAPTAAPVPKSAAQARCERHGGDWAATAASGLRTCVKPTRDGGRQCSKSTDCAGECLARSRSCSPIAPLLGCHDILLADGTRTTQCLE